MTTVVHIWSLSGPREQEWRTLCSHVERICYPNIEALNIQEEMNLPGAFGFCAVESSDEEKKECMGYVLFQKSSMCVAIKKIVVLPACRRRGIGRQLLRSVEEFAVLKKIHLCSLNVEVSNHPAISLYLDMGYAKSDCRTDFYDLGRHAYHMEKVL